MQETNDGCEVGPRERRASFLEQGLVTRCIPYDTGATIQVMISAVPCSKVKDGCITRHLRGKAGTPGNELGRTGGQALEVFELDGVAVYSRRRW